MPRVYSSLLVMSLLSAFSLITFDLYQPSLPFITQQFATTPSLSQLTLSIYLFFFGITQLIWGPLIDHFGRRQLLPGSLILVTLASLICAFATNIYILILGRALQGIALCCAHLVSYACSRDIEDANQRANVLSYMSMISSCSPIFAPVLGSIIFTYLGWQANFIFMAAIALILIWQSKNGLCESPFWTKPKKAFSLKNTLLSYKKIIPVSRLWWGSFIMMLSFSAVMLSILNSSYLIGQ